jgi:hypothetical protein
MPNHAARRDDDAAAGEPDMLTSPRPPHCSAPQSPRCATGATSATARSFRLGRRFLYRRGDLRAWTGVHDHHDGPDAA